MGLNDIQKRMGTWADTLKLAAFFLALFWFAVTTSGAVAWSLWQAYDGREWVREYLGITDLSRKLDGEDRLILTRSMDTYALTPVSRRNPVITATFTVRTAGAGQACRIMDAIPMFEGQRHIPRQGVLLTPVTNVGPIWTPVEVEARVPVNLSLGRAVMWLLIDYDCPDGRKTDQTDAVIFDFVE